MLSGVQGPPLGDYFLNQSVEVGARWSCGGTICGQRGGASLWDGRLQSPREDQQQGGDRPRVTWRNGWLLSWDDTGGAELVGRDRHTPRAPNPELDFGLSQGPLTLVATSALLVVQQMLLGSERCRKSPAELVQGGPCSPAGVNSLQLTEAACDPGGPCALQEAVEFSPLCAPGGAGSAGMLLVVVLWAEFVQGWNERSVL